MYIPTMAFAIAFVIMYYKYVRAYYTSVSVRVKFNLDVRIKGTI